MQTRSLFILFILCISTTSSTSSNVTFECSSGWELIGTHCYNFVNTEVDFEDAKDICHKYGAALLVVRDEVEARNVSTIAVKKFSSDHFWIYNGKDGQNADRGILNLTFCNGMWQPDEPRETDDDVAIASNLKGRWAVTWLWKNLPFVCRTPACSVGSFRCSDGTCLNRKWRCDGVFDCKDHSDENDCQGQDSIKYYRNNSGFIDATAVTNSAFYQWIIEGQPGEILKIELETLTIEDYVDSVRVYSGGPSIKSSDLIKEIKWSLTQKLTVFGMNHFLIVTVQSLGKAPRFAIKATWSSDNEVSWRQVEKVNVNNLQSLITSPYYNSSLTPVTFKKEWLLTAPEGELITLEILDNTFEKNVNSDVHIITNVGFVLKELNSSKAVYISSKNYMSVIIKTKSGKRKFKAHYKTGCDFTTKLSSATFSLTDLPTNVTCTWKVENEFATNLSLTINQTHFDDFQDFLQVYHGTDLSPRSIISTLNHSTAGAQELHSPSGSISFVYFSDTFFPGVQVQGKISADCKDLRKFSNMNVTYTRTNEEGKAYYAKVTCNEGFSFKQEEYNKNKTLYGICKDDGRWDWGSQSYTRIPECQVVYCGLPPQIPNGFIDTIGNITYKSVASYQCFSGFQIDGSPNITCKANGHWSTPPFCVVEKCKGLPLVQHASNITFGNLSQGVIIKYSCDPGYDLQGSQEIVCLSNKTWSHKQPVCRELTCPLPLIEHGHFKSLSKGLPKFGGKAGLYCDVGYHNSRKFVQNDTSYTCSFNRTLSVQNDTCVDVDECKNKSLNNCSSNQDCVNLQGSYACICKSGYNGTNCTDVDECTMGLCHQKCDNLPGSYHCSCFDGFKLYAENGTNHFYIPTGEDGLKAGDIFQINSTCVPIACENDPKLPANGHALKLKSHYYYNDTVQIVCDFGHKLEGSSFATCQHNGNWTYIHAPSCKKLTCQQPAIGQHEALRVPNATDINPGDTLIISCSLHSGHTVNKTLFCAPDPNNLENFTLQGDDQNCPEVNCGEPWKIPGANQTIVQNATYGSSFDFTCDSTKGFTIVGASALGNNTVICQEDGKWGYGNLTCEGKRCRDPGTKSGTIQIVKTSYEIDQIVQYNCTRPGFSAVPNDTLVCEYKNGNATWSGDPPTCEDLKPPKITCPSPKSVELYSPLVYTAPTVKDNSGLSCLMILSGPPSGVSVVSKNMTVKYKAIDAKNEAFCEFSVTLKDLTEPSIECQPVYRVLEGNKSEILHLTEALLKSHSDDGKIMFEPEGSINLTVGNVVSVRASIKKDNGLAKECAFLVHAVSRTCLNDSLSPPEHGEIRECSGNASRMTCKAVCDDGFLYQNASDSAVYTCIDGVWTTKLPLKPCLTLSDSIFNFDVQLKYKMSGKKLPRTSNYSAQPCLNKHYEVLSQLVEKIYACGNNRFKAIHFSSDESDIASDFINFTLQLLTPGGNQTLLEDCAAEMQNQSIQLFGPTTPIINNTMTCFSPWFVLPDIHNKIVPTNFSCDSGVRMVHLDGRQHCLPCGPGMFLNNNVCEECEDGFYQDEENQLSCKKCPDGVFKSHEPRTSENHCFELCPAGFASPSGYLDDNCTACPEDYFSSNSSHWCLPCPNDGSTVGVSGAKSESECSEPCPKGYYSLTGYYPCSPCPQHFFINTTGARSCVECPLHNITFGNGSTSITDCIGPASVCTDDFCSLVGTLDNTSCQISDHRPVCTCKPGFYGDSCNLTCDICNPNPCYNGGICTSLGGLNFTCTCQNAVTCDFTENKKLEFSTNINDVTFYENGKDFCKDMCSNDTSCMAYIVDDYDYCYQYKKLSFVSFDNPFPQSYVKNCSSRQLFDGPLCEVDLVKDCNDSICTMPEFCMDLVDDIKCVCPMGGGFDSRCAKLDDLCMGIDCSNHGQCSSFGSVRSVCVCYPGYTGENCEIDIDDCESNKHGCLYNGTCHDRNNSYSCSCQNGYSGDHCEVLPDFCSIHDCKLAHGGICINDSQKLTANCTCKEHYIPDPLEPDACIPINYCLSSPCVNGTCTNITGGFKCHCNPGFEGSLCQHNTDDCVAHGCMNGASCKDGIDGYTCECPAGFMGSYCEIDIDDCNCVNDTTVYCVDLANDFVCHCKPGFKGKNCSESFSICAEQEPCLHGGNCSDFVGGYNCTCPTGWRGVNCELQTDHCSSKPCQNNGICHNLFDQYYCQCQNGTTGKNCEKVKSICGDFGNSVCTVNGQCGLNGTTAECHCLPDYAGVACELQKDYCAGNPCGGEKCTLTNNSYVCESYNVKSFNGDTANETKLTCDKCPQNVDCRDFVDHKGYLNHVCMCPANATCAGNTCQVLDRNYDLAFLEDFADKETFVTSERGFFLENNTDLSVTMWVVAAREIQKDRFVLALRSSSTNDHFFMIFKSEVQIRTKQNDTERIPFEDLQTGQQFSLDESFTWHFLSVSWSADGNLKIVYGYNELYPQSVATKLPYGEYVFIDIGHSFNGYISQVSFWNSTLTIDDSYDIYNDKLAVPQADKLLLGWTPFSYDNSVLKIYNSSAEDLLSVCDIPNTIAKSGLNTPECQSRTFTDKTPPKFNHCKDTALLQTDYNHHQVSSSRLGYEYTDESGKSPQLPERQFFSFGAFDIAVSAVDTEGNVGVCMTRVFVTPNKCEDLIPSTAYLTNCSDNSNGKKVVCPNGMHPSVPTSKYISCGRLLTYNLDNMYENPDRIVCGVQKTRSATVNVLLSYNVRIDCKPQLLSNFQSTIESHIATFNKQWPGLCTNQTCSNVIVKGSCAATRDVDIHIEINSLSDSVNSSEGLIQVITAAENMAFNVSNLGHAALKDKAHVNIISVCEKGYGSVGNFCVQCGPGSYYHEGEKKCELCELNKYSDISGMTACTDCLSNRVTLQKGSSSVSDCKDKCPIGQMLNLTTNKCVQCPKNFYQDQVGKSYCFPCPPSTGTEDTGAANITECRELCRPGTELKDQNCVECQRGFYRQGNEQDPCTQCPLSNSTTKHNGSISEDECIIPKCPPGSFVEGNVSLSCKPCDFGSYQPNEAEFECSPCGANYTTEYIGTVNASMCRFVCPAGHEENPPNSNQCLPCKRGFYRTEDLDQRFNDCTMCPNNMTTLMEGSKNISDCSIAKCSKGFILSANSSACQPCSIGTYQNVDLPLPTTNCQLCPQNTSTHTDGSTSISDCEAACAPGFGLAQGICQPCQRGSWNNGNETMKFVECQKCPSNFTTDVLENATDLNNCTIRDCGPGTFINNRTNDCTPCEIGFYQDQPFQTTCSKCPLQTNTSTTGSKTSDDCTIVCSEGTEGDGRTCIPCSDDQYKNYTGFGKCQNCSGDFTSTPGNRTACTEVFCDLGREPKYGRCSDCDEGYYKSSRGNLPCSSCPANTTTVWKASTSIQDCSIVVCQAGNYRNESTNSCFPCPLGTFQEQPGRNECISCPKNFTTSSKGSLNSSQCYINCSQGYYHNGTSQCIPCSLGQYQNETGQVSCKNCSKVSGFDSSTYSEASTKETDCLPLCPGGHYVNIKSRSCDECPIGYYKNITSLSASCQQCDSGFINANLGEINSTSCIFEICKKGTYRDSKSSIKCKHCPIGEYQNSDSSLDVSACTPCPPGQSTLLEGAPAREGYCILNCSKGEEYSITNKSCSACEVGMYRPEGPKQPPICLYCPTGYTTLHQGDTDCIPNPTAALPNITVDLSVVATINVEECSNPAAVSNAIQDIVLQLLQNQNGKYSGLCSSDCKSNVIIKVENLCGKSSRKKRQSGYPAAVNVTVKNIDSVLKRKKDGVLRSALAVLLEAFYDLYPVEKNLTTYQLTDVSVTVAKCGDQCVVIKSYYPQFCAPGQFTGAQQCEDCRKGSYSTNPVSEKCIPCPEGQTTAKDGALDITFCDGICATEDYCGSQGVCEEDTYGKHYCRCKDNYKGLRCEQKPKYDESNSSLVIGIGAGVGGFLLILLLIFGICAYRKRTNRSRESSLISESEFEDRGFPMFNFATVMSDPTMYRGETVDLNDNDPFVYIKGKNHSLYRSIES